MYSRLFKASTRRLTNAYSPRMVSAAYLGLDARPLNGSARRG
jgi:hypothetical protein